ncbi:ATP-binding protein [Flavobacterium antarcticum]|uniref:sensor histidine kinase n=1 Tax=Flavobacterium antarcticum TaxID=271155 RepID=UPI0003B5648A|nr:GAF domain-containing sensor histidine kinase [Flavobacterium antarcticum]
MKTPEIPSNETLRLKALKEYSILDTLPEKEYDDITQLASQICGTSISSISLIDEKRQWFKSKVGLDVNETDKGISFCGHAIMEPNKIFTIKDSRLDERFQDNPLVVGEPHVIFYTGVPLVSPEGFALGTLCVIDDKPKELDSEQLSSLKALSNQVVSLFELRKSKMLLERLTNDLENRNRELEKFARVAAHDIKSPLNNISSLTEILLHQYSAELDDEAKMMMTMLDTSSQTLRELVDGILEHSKSDHILTENRSVFNLDKLVKQCIELLDNRGEYHFVKDFENALIAVNKVALQQILLNLMGNAIKYNKKPQVEITIKFSEDDQYYTFAVSDNGMGIAAKNLEKIFDIFEVVSNEDRFGKKGTGIGLSTVKKLVEGLGGKIQVFSVLGEGTTFKFTIAKQDFI